MALFDDANPDTTIKGYGYKNKEKAIDTIKLVEKTKRGRSYKFQVINTMYNRAKHHKNTTKDMKEAMKVFEGWLNEYKYPFLPLKTIRKYEKLADYYNVSLKARGKEKPSTSDEGFLVVYKKVHGNVDKLKTYPVKKSNPHGINWFSKRNNQVKAKYNQAKNNNIELFHKTGKLKDLPTKIHINMIMWGYSPYPDRLDKISYKL